MPATGYNGSGGAPASAAALGTPLLGHCRATAVKSTSHRGGAGQLARLSSPLPPCHVRGAERVIGGGCSCAWLEGWAGVPGDVRPLAACLCFQPASLS